MNLTANATTPYSINIAFESPNELTGTILSYKVIVALESAIVYSVSIPPHTSSAIQQLTNMYSSNPDVFDLTISVGNLEQGKTYNVSAFAVTAAGSGYIATVPVVIPVIISSNDSASIVIGTAIGASLGLIVLVLIIILVSTNMLTLLLFLLNST